MLSATVQVAADRSATLMVADSTTRHSDLATALIHAGELCREAESPATLEITDSRSTHTVFLDTAGKISDSPPPPDTDTAADPDSPTQSVQDKPPIPAEPSTDTLPLQTPIADSPTADSGTASPADPTTHPAADAPADAEDSTYPVATQYSGPAQPVGTGPRKPKERRTRERRAHRGQRSRPSRHITVPGIVLLVLVLIAVVAYLFPSVVGSPTSDSPATEGSSHNNGQFDSLNVENAKTPVPGFSKGPAWENKVGTDASVTANSRGVLVVTKSKLQVLNATTGKVRYSEKLDKRPVDFSVDTTVSGQKALLWRSGRTAKALLDSAKKPVTYKLPQHARLSSAGSSVLVKDGNRLFTFGDRGLEKVALPPSGTTPMALDGDTLISAAFGGPVYLTNAESGKQRKGKLESPGSGLQIIRWISAGYGNVVTLWGKPGSQTNSGHSVQLVIHNAKTGAIKSTVSTTTDMVSDNTKWVRGQGHKLAVIGRYLFDMRTGLLVRESTSQRIEFADPRGTLTPGTLSGENVLVAGDTAWKTTTNLLAVTDDDELAMVRQGDGTIVAYPKT